MKTLKTIITLLLLLSFGITNAQTVSVSSKLDGIKYSTDILNVRSAVNEKGVGYYTLQFSKEIYKVQNSEVSTFVELGDFDKTLKKGKEVVLDILYTGSKFYLMSAALNSTGKGGVITARALNETANSLDETNKINVLTINGDDINLDKFSWKLSPDNTKIVFAYTNISEGEQAVAVYKVTDMKLVHAQNIPLSGLSTGEKVEIMTSVDNGGNVFMVRSNSKDRMFKDKISMLYAKVSSKGELTAFEALNIKATMLTDFNLTSTKSGTYISFAHGTPDSRRNTGITIMKFESEGISEMLMHNFTGNDFYVMDNAYSTRPSTKTAKNSLVPIKILDLLEDANGELILITEQHSYGSENSDYPSNISMFIIKGKELSNIVNIKKKDNMTAGSSIASYVRMEDDKVMVLTGTTDQGNLMIYTYDTKSKRLTSKMFDRGVDDTKISGSINYDVSAGASGYFFGAMHSGTKVKIVLAKF